MSKAIKYFYTCLWLLVVPIIIGESVGQYFLAVYKNFNRHWIAGAIICLASGAVVTWFPMFFLIEKNKFAEFEIDTAMP